MSVWCPREIEQTTSTLDELFHVIATGFSCVTKMNMLLCLKAQQSYFFKDIKQSHSSLD